MAIYRTSRLYPGGTVAGDLLITGTLGVQKTTTTVDVVTSGAADIVVDDACALYVKNVAGTNTFCFDSTTGGLTVSGASVASTYTTKASNAGYVLDSPVKGCIYGKQTAGEMFFGVGNDLGHQFVFGTSDSRTDDFAHVAAAYPVMYIHSQTRSATATNQYGAFYHDTTNFNLSVGLGNFVIGSVVIDPTGGLSDGTLSSASGVVTGLVSLTDGTASWVTNSLSGFTSISGTTLTDGTFSVTGGAITGVTSYVQNGVTVAINTQNVDDDDSLDIASGTAGFGTVMAGDNEAYARFRWSTDGTVTLDEKEGSVVATDTDANLCIFDNGTNVRIRNRLGATKEVTYDLRYR